MKVKLLVSRAGNGFAQAYGSTVEMDVAEARRHVDAGMAEALEPFPEDKKKDGKTTKSEQ